MAELLPDIAPTFDSGAMSESARVNECKFGDGYSQRVGDGLNAIVNTIPLQWQYISETDKNTLVNFFRARGGYEYFLWTYPVGTGQTQKKWVCKRWTWRAVNAIHWEVNAEIEEVFDS